jgi:hypothetical protein
MLNLTRLARQPRASETLPLGVDLVSGFVVAIERSRDACRVIAAGPFDPAGGRDALLRVLDELGVRERRAIVAVSPSAARVGVLQHGASVPPMLRDAAAKVYAPDLIPSVPQGDELVSRFAGLSGAVGTLVASTRGEVDRTVERARELGLEPAAVDVPAAVWIRVNGEGVIDLRNNVVTVPTPTGVFSAVAAQGASGRERAANVAQVVANARTQRQYRGEAVAVTGLQDSSELAVLAERIGAAPSLYALEIDGRIMPPWALAYGLALWSLW